MAVSSISVNLIHSLPFLNSSSSPISKPKLSSSSFVRVNCSLKLRMLRLSPSSTRVHAAAAEVLESQSSLEAPPETLDGSGLENVGVGGTETPSTSSLSVEADADKRYDVKAKKKSFYAGKVVTSPINHQMAPKQKIRIKLRSYWVPLIEDSCKQILDAAKNTNAKTMGPVPLPTKRRIYCVLKSPHVHKDARFHFEIRTHQRLIDILYPTAQTIDSLMQLDLPAGVDVEVKL